jgi:GGDEF domain-containing protein
LDLDGRTLLVAASLTSILLAMLVLHVRRWIGKSIHGLGWWAAAVILLTGSTLLLAMRGIVGNWFSIVAANTGFVLAAGLFYHSLRRFYDLRDQFLLSLLPAVVVFGSFSFLYEGEAAETGYRLRVIIAMLMTAIVALACTRIIFTRRPMSPNALLTGAVWSLLFLLLAVRAALAAAGYEPTMALFRGGTWTAAWLGIVTIMLSMQTMGFLLMVTDRIRDGYVHLATHDPLTGILNRGAFVERAKTALRQARKQRRPVTLLLADLDRFKAINDTYGHGVGDRALKAFADVASA